MSTLSSSSCAFYDPDQLYALQLLNQHAAKVDNKHASLPHNSEYGLSLHNLTDRRSECKLYVGKTSVGSFDLKPNQTFNNIRSVVGMNRQFTFVRTDSKEAKEAGVNTESKFNGIIRAEFKAEKKRVVYAQKERGGDSDDDDDEYEYVQECKTKSKKCGTTIFGKSIKDPNYRTVEGIKEYDEAFTRTIEFRLVEAAGISSS